MFSKLARAIEGPPGGAKERTVDEILDMLDDFGLSTASGATVSEGKAMRQATVFACIRILTGAIGQLDVGLWRGLRDENEQQVTDTAVARLLDRPNGWMSPEHFWSLVVKETELTGNSLWFKNRNRRNEVVQLLPIVPGAAWWELIGDRVRYVVNDPVIGINGEFYADRILHFRNIGDALSGFSTISLQREEIGLALQMQKHGATLFKNGAQIGKVVKHPGAMSDRAYDRLKKDIAARWEGVENAHKTVVLEEGMDVDSVAMTPEDSQFIESRKFSQGQIAQIFGIPPFLLGDTERSTSWGTGLESISRGFVRFTLQPRLTRYRQTLAIGLLTAEQARTHRFKFDVEPLTTGDFQARMQGYSTAIGSGVMSPNEARRRESMNPREGGDEFAPPGAAAASATVDDVEPPPDSGENAENEER